MQSRPLEHSKNRSKESAGSDDESCDESCDASSRRQSIADRKADFRFIRQHGASQSAKAANAASKPVGIRLEFDQHISRASN